MLELRPSFATLAVVPALAVSLAHARPGPRQRDGKFVCRETIAPE